MVQNTQSQNSILNVAKKGFHWTKIVIYGLIGFFVFYIVYSVIVSIMHFLSPIAKTLSDFFGSGKGANPGITGAPWWAWFGMAWYLLPAGALGIGASLLYKQYKFHNPNLSDAEIAEKTQNTQQDVEQLYKDNPNKTETEIRVMQIEKTKNIMIEESNAKIEAANAVINSDASQGAKQAAEAEKQAEEQAKTEYEESAAQQEKAITESGE